MDILAMVFLHAWGIKYFEKNVSQQEIPTLDSTIKYFHTLEHITILVQAINPYGKAKRYQDDSNQNLFKPNKDKKFESRNKILYQD